MVTLLHFFFKMPIEQAFLIGFPLDVVLAYLIIVDLPDYFTHTEHWI